MQRLQTLEQRSCSSGAPISGSVECAGGAPISGSVECAGQLQPPSMAECVPRSGLLMSSMTGVSWDRPHFYRSESASALGLDRDMAQTLATSIARAERRFATVLATEQLDREVLLLDSKPSPGHAVAPEASKDQTEALKVNAKYSSSINTSFSDGAGAGMAKPLPSTAVAPEAFGCCAGLDPPPKAV